MTATPETRIEIAQRMLEEAKAEIAHPDCLVCLDVTGVFDRIGELYGFPRCAIWNRETLGTGTDWPSSAVPTAVRPATPALPGAGRTHHGVSPASQRRIMLQYRALGVMQTASTLHCRSQ